MSKVKSVCSICSKSFVNLKEHETKMHSIWLVSKDHETLYNTSNPATKYKCGGHYDSERYSYIPFYYDSTDDGKYLYEYCITFNELQTKVVKACIDKYTKGGEDFISSKRLSSKRIILE